VSFNLGQQMRINSTALHLNEQMSANKHSHDVKK